MRVRGESDWVRGKYQRRSSKQFMIREASNAGQTITAACCFVVEVPK